MTEVSFLIIQRFFFLLCTYTALAFCFIEIYSRQVFFGAPALTVMVFFIKTETKFEDIICKFHCKRLKCKTTTPIAFFLVLLRFLMRIIRGIPYHACIDLCQLYNQVCHTTLGSQARVSDHLPALAMYIQSRPCKLWVRQYVTSIIFCPWFVT